MRKYSRTDHRYYEQRGVCGSRCMLGGDPPAPASSTTTTQQVFSPEETAARKQVMDAAAGIYGQQQPLWASMVNPAAKPVGASADTLQAQQMVKGAATGPGQTMATNAASAANFGLSGDVLNPESNPGLQGSIDSALRRVSNTYTDPGGVLSQIRGNFTAGNSGGSGTREGIASGIAGRNYLNTVGDVTSTMTSDAYNKGLDYMKSAMAFSPNSYNLMMQPGLSVGAVGTQQEQYAQAQANATAGDTAWQLQAPWAGLQPYASTVLGFSNPGMTATGTSQMSSGSGGMGLLGGAMMGAQMGNMIAPGGSGAMIGAGAGALLRILGIG